MEHIIGFLSTPLGVVFFTGGVVFLVWFGSVQNIKTEIKEARGEVGDIRAEVKDVRADIKAEVRDIRAEINAKVKNLKTDMDNIKVDIKSILQLLPSSAAKSKSPLTLTEMGKEIAKDLDADKAIAELVDKLNIPPNISPYNIQYMTEDKIHRDWRTLFSADQISKIENSAYENGISIYDVLKVYMLLTRDHILKKRGLPVLPFAKKAKSPTR